MAEVIEKPKVRCDNCGAIEEKTPADASIKPGYKRPKNWGSMIAEGGRTCRQTYGTGKERLSFTDLCPDCAEAAFQAAATALESERIKV